MNRITIKDCRNAAALLNHEVYGYPIDYDYAFGVADYKKPETIKAAYYLDKCNEGIRLVHRDAGQSGESDITPRGTARETFYLIRAFTDGVKIGRTIK